MHIESTKGLYLCSFMCAKVPVSDVKWCRLVLPRVSWKIPAEIWIPNVIRRLREHGTASTVRIPGLVWQNITTSTESFSLKVAPAYSRTLRQDVSDICIFFFFLLFLLSFFKKETGRQKQTKKTSRARKQESSTGQCVKKHHLGLFVCGLPGWGSVKRV